MPNADADCAALSSINELSKVDLSFPIIADPTREIAKLYDMLDEQDLTNLDQKGYVPRPASLIQSSKLTSCISHSLPFTVRSVFVIDPKKVRELGDLLCRLRSDLRPSACPALGRLSAWS